MITNVLLLCAYPPDAEGLGGTQVVTAALAARAPESVRLMAAYPRDGNLLVEAFHPNRKVMAVLPWGVSDPVEPSAMAQAALEAALVGTQSRVLHVHSFATSVPAIRGAVTNSGAALALTLHDHGLVCENYQLLERGERYCAIPEDLTRCDRCLAKVYGRRPGRIRTWRSSMNDLVGAADHVIAPSSSVLSHALKVHPQLENRSTLVPWGVPPSTARCAPSTGASRTLRVAVVGLHAKVKGADRLPALVEACRALDVEWHLFGATEGASLREVRRAAPRVVPHGAYRRSTLPDRLLRAGCDIALLPSIAPESFSLTLSEVLAAGLPVIVSNLGALEERVLSGGCGWTFDPWDSQQLVARLGELAANRTSIAEAAHRVRQLPRRSEDDMAADHARIWNELGNLAAGRQVSPEIAEPAAALYEAGERRATRHGRRFFTNAVARLRHTDWYRDLRLRKLLSEKARSSVESFATRIVGRVIRR